MRRLALVIAPLIAVAGCSGKAHRETQTTVTRNGVTTTTITNREVDGDDADDAGTSATATTVAGASGLKIDSDQFKANLEIPGLSFGGDHLDLDGMKLYPGSTVKGVRVHAVDHPGSKRGEVVVTFTSPAAPLAVARHLAREAARAGFALSSNTTALVAGAKRDGDGEDNRFTATLNPTGTATLGQLTMTGTKG